jgi:hypothetical protein
MATIGTVVIAVDRIPSAVVWLMKENNESRVVFRMARLHRKYGCNVDDLSFTTYTYGDYSVRTVYHFQTLLLSGWQHQGLGQVLLLSSVHRQTALALGETGTKTTSKSALQKDCHFIFYQAHYLCPWLG